MYVVCQRAIGKELADRGKKQNNKYRNSEI